MKRIFLLAVALMACVSVRAGHITLCDTLRGSAIYPATTHTFKVTVPDSYDGKSPARLYLGLDGILCNAPEVLDALMDEGVLESTIAVFLQPGVVYSEDGSVLSYNRSNEFDATDDRFARFLAEELLPRVESLVTPDGRRLALASDPAGRMIFGLSSGGIAAFTAAWHRPDLFGKVFSGCGTFVPMRGGNDLQALVRKTEPRPLRIFLQDGFQDTWNPLFGSWFEANAMLASALEFAGYDFDVDWTNGGHSVTRSSEIFPKVMRWMFRDGYAPVRPGKSGNGTLNGILVEGGKWEPCSGSAAPAAKAKKGKKTPVTVSATYPDSRHRVVVFDDSNYLYKEILDSKGAVIASQPFYWLHSYNNSTLVVPAMAFDSAGNLWVLTDSDIQICDQNGRVRVILPLPAGFKVDDSCRLDLGDGFVEIVSPTAAWRRSFRVAPATPGVLPPSQGPA